MSDIFEIQGKKIMPGDSTVIELDITKQKTRNQFKIPVFVERSEVNGPTLLLTGGVHGDEVNGVAIVRDFIRKGYNKPKRGSVICVPVLNIFGFLNRSRDLPDGRDLNRMAPGTATGSLASQLAYMYINEVARLADYVLDFHAGGRDLVNFPNVRCSFEMKRSLELARVFDAPFTVHSNQIPNSLREYYDLNGIVSLLYEGGKSLELDPFVIQTGLQGALNVMRHLGMQEGEIINQNPDKMLEKSTWIRSEFSGMFQSIIENGVAVKPNDVLGFITDPYGDFYEEVKAPYEMYIFGINTAPLIYKGDPLFHVSQIET